MTQSSDPEEIKKLRESAPDYKETMEIGRDFDRWVHLCCRFEDKIGTGTMQRVEEPMAEGGGLSEVQRRTCWSGIGLRYPVLIILLCARR